MATIKLKKILKENFTRSLAGGIITMKPTNNISLSGIVKEKYGEVEEEKVDVKGLTSEISSYNKLGESIFGESNITKVAEKLSWIANQAKSHTLSETEDWFDKITVNRNMKELTGLSNQFKKVATEAQSLQERMSGLYEDMGHILGRYYEIGEGKVKSEDTSPDFKEDDGYKAFFQKALKKWGVSSPDEIKDEDKKEFYDYVDRNWKADKETD